MFFMKLSFYSPKVHTVFLCLKQNLNNNGREFEEILIMLISFSVNSSTLNNLYLLLTHSANWHSLLRHTFSEGIFFCNETCFLKIALNSYQAKIFFFLIFSKEVDSDELLKGSNLIFCKNLNFWDNWQNLVR